MLITTKYDSILSRYGEKNGIPLPYLRALAKRESDMNPLSDMGPNGAKGILQVIPVVRNDYNERHGTDYQSQDLFNPEICTMIAVDLLGRILHAFSKHPCLEPDWRSSRWVELFTFGWNAGYSEKAGVGFVVGKMEDRNTPCSQITIDTVSDYAGEVGASPYVARKDKVAWCKGVTSLYFRLAKMPQKNISTVAGKTVKVASFGLTLYAFAKLLEYLFKKE